MFCSCRTAPLRLFVRSLAQLHLSEQPAVRPAARVSQTLRALPPRREAFSTTSRVRDTSQPIEGETSKFIERNSDIPTSNEESHDTFSNTTTSPEDANPRTSDSSAHTRPSHKKRLRIKSTSTLSDAKTAAPTHTRESWQVQKAALKEKFPEGWRPMKRLSPDAVAGIRALHAQFPDQYTTPQLAKQFEVSAEAIRRILKSKWAPSPEEEEMRQERWFRRGKSVWSRYAELGMKPPQKWRREGVARDPTWHEKRQAAISRRQQEEESAGAGAKLHRRLGGGIM
ncbi:hypothetical protein F5X68DRAFT_206044 [Plectosphaerella plurivora]|uniref:Required for respiratory growth protein 9, mitochondrial n=1 Tax=Plectosphaerella plurivora TaxID=936078 RepID=A0A9P9ABC3_9PEZI|nr:hypothetical protein F5X68DRAFT_206044 [Plectosphaerella plurivora]